MVQFLYGVPFHPRRHAVHSYIQNKSADILCAVKYHTICIHLYCYRLPHYRDSILGLRNQVYTLHVGGYYFGIVCVVQATDYTRKGVKHVTQQVIYYARSYVHVT